MMATNRYIWIIPDSQNVWLWKALGIYLARRTGLTPIMIVPSLQDKAFYETQGGISFPGEIVVRDDFYLAVVQGAFDTEPSEQVFRRAAEYERRHGITLTRSMLLADRHLGRAFIPGGAGYPRSHISENSTLVRSYQTCLASAAFWGRLVVSHSPRWVISCGGGGISYKPLALLCRERNIPLRILFPFRFGDSYFWGRDEYGCFPELETALRDFSWPDNKDVEDVGRFMQPNGLAANTFYTERLSRSLQWQRIVYMSGREVMQRLYWRYKGYRKGLIGIKLVPKIRNFILARRNMNRLNWLALRDFSKLDSRKIVYFPLQQEPESGTLVLSPYCTNQVALVRELALSLPADAQLVVKEHIWALHGRPPGFYEQLAEIPNVVLIHPAASSLELIRRAALVCVITSSAGYEAAVLGKPVVHFGFRSSLFLLPHVRHLAATSEFDALAEILAKSDDPDEAAARKRAGARYYLAARSVCMDLSAFRIHGRKELLTEDECGYVVDHLFRTLPELATAPDRLCPPSAKQL